MSSRKISKAKVQHFFDEGYLILPRVFGREDLEPLKREMAEQVGQAARRLADAGKITDIHEGEPFETRLARICDDSREAAEEIMKELEGVAGGGYTGREMFGLLTHPKLLDV